MDEKRENEKRDVHSKGCFDTGNQLGIAGKSPDTVIKPEEVVYYDDKDGIEEDDLKMKSPVLFLDAGEDKIKTHEEYKSITSHHSKIVIDHKQQTNDLPVTE